MFFLMIAVSIYALTKKIFVAPEVFTDGALLKRCDARSFNKV